MTTPENPDCPVSARDALRHECVCGDRCGADRTQEPMMDLGWSLELGIAMCRQWGIDPDQCASIDVHWRPGQLPYADVELLLNEGVVHELLTLAPVQRERTTTTTETIP